jgi:hypothetical protein
MLRFTIALVFATVVSLPAASADRTAVRHVRHRAAVLLPAGLPRPHYKFKTTISYRAPALAYPRYAGDYAGISYVPPLIGAPLLSDSSMLPGYYGAAYSYDYQGYDYQSYDYQGSYYGGPKAGFWNRLPYACGVYGYC